jgi:hypothetical protein
MASADFLSFSLTSLRGFGGCQSFCPSPPDKISPSKLNLFPLTYLLHLHHGIRAVLDFALFGKLVRPAHAFYAVPVRQTEGLPPASFRFHLTVDTLAFS